MFQCDIFNKLQGICKRKVFGVLSTLSLIIITLGIVFCGGCGSSTILAPYKSSCEFERMAEARNIRQLTVKTKQGKITVKGNQQDDIQITVNVEACGGSPSGAQRLAKEVELSIARSNDSLDISPKYPPLVDHNLIKVNLDVTVPWISVVDTNVKDAEVSQETVIMHFSSSTGCIKVTDVTGNVAINSSTGNVRIAGIQGSVHSTTSTGSIHINNVTNGVEAKSSTGNITVNETIGPANLGTSTGNINVKNVQGGVTAKSSTGNVTVESCLGSADVSSNTGSVNVVVEDFNGRDTSASSSTNSATLTIISENI